MSQPEWKLQTAVGKFVRSAVTVPHYFECYDRSKNDSDGRRHMFEAARHIKAGTPDAALIVAGRVYRIELKAPGNTPTTLQEERMAEIRAAGGFAGWADTVMGVGQLLAECDIPLACNWPIQALHHDAMLESSAAKKPAPKKSKSRAEKPTIAAIRRMEKVRAKTMF